MASRPQRQTNAPKQKDARDDGHSGERPDPNDDRDDLAEDRDPEAVADTAGLRSMLAKAFDGRRPATLPIEEDDDEDDVETFSEPDEPDAAVAQQATAKKGSTKWRGRAIKSLIGLLLLIFAVWVPAWQLFQVASAEAVVNAQIVTLRAPIEGAVDAAIGIPEIGVELGEGSNLVQIVNPRADLFRVNEAARAIALSLDRRAQITADLRSLRMQQAALVEQVEEFRLARIEYLTALLVVPRGAVLQVGTVDERVPFLRARLGLANPEGRAAQLFDDELEEAVIAFQASVGLPRDGIVGGKTLAALNGSLNSDIDKGYAIVIELDALRRGVFVGDSYNDKPSSAQRLDAIEIEIARLESELGLNIAAHSRLLEVEARERAWVDQMSSASITAPVNGRVWEVLTAPGEQVVMGQELIRMLDCANPLVTAAVSEAVYNRLAVGMAASFTFREGGDAMVGYVVQLTGFAAAPANLAITPTALRAESYRVTVAVPEIATGEACAVGRTGRVVFDATR